MLIFSFILSPSLNRSTGLFADASGDRGSRDMQESHGCSFCAEDDGVGIPVSVDIFSKNPSKEYKFGKTANIIQGSMQGLRFTYFEKALIEDGRDSAEETATRSIVAIDNSANEHFESGEVFDKDLVFYRENGKICFWWNGNSSGVIPVKKLEQWLADIAGAFKTGE
jgi:hypothetical protein